MADDKLKITYLSYFDTENVVELNAQLENCGKSECTIEWSSLVHPKGTLKNLNKNDSCKEFWHVSKNSDRSFNMGIYENFFHSFLKYSQNSSIW